MKSVFKVFLLLALLNEMTSFNIDLNRKWIIPESKDAFFGHRVVQYSNKEGNGVLVTAPLSIKYKRLVTDIYQCTVLKQQCKPVNLEDYVSVTKKMRKRPGLFLTRKPRDHELLACQQYKSFRNKSSVEELNGICFMLSSDLSKTYNSFSPAEMVEKTFQEINSNNNNNKVVEDIMEGRLEAVFVLDGPGSISPSEFEMAKSFIINIMTRLLEASSHVGIGFNKNAMAELQLIATDPDQDQLFLVEDYTVLEGLVEKVKRSIFMTKTKGSLLSNLNENNNNNNEDEDEDPDKGTEIAIVLDGSGSIDPNDFEKAKMFIINMIQQFWKTCYQCEFAVVQYGEEIRTEFDLQDSQDSQGSAEVIWEKLKNITQLKKVTKTASALNHVLNDIFSEKHGSRKDSSKIIIVLTDGEIFMDPLNLADVLNSPKMADIDDRYAIGVGVSFNKSSAMEELAQIAKYNDSDHVFRVDNYEGLNSLLSKLGKNIIGIEGTKGSTLQLELAQAGFSASSLDDGSLLIGAVGAFDWSGGMILQKADKSINFLNDSSNKEDRATTFGYLGYSVASIQRNSDFKYLYVSGAPRHSGTGKVLVFRQDKVTIGRMHDLNGEQVGSYFGAELCAFDFNKDNVTDFLLVGAPFFHIRGEEGKVYVYRITSEDVLTSEMELRGSSKYYFARFGFAISNIGDINKDGYNDIAIGAPLEEDLPGTSGSIYIFNGQANGLMHTFSQRIAAADVDRGLVYFGQSIDGGYDVTSDDLIDIAIGAYGYLTVLRSRPVITFKATVKFSSEEVPLSFQMAKGSSKNVITAEVCFEMESEFKNIQLYVSYIDYTMELDVTKENKRIQFEDNKRLFSLRYIESSCWKHKLLILPCTSDCFSDIIITIKHSLRNADETRDTPAPVLDKFNTSSSNFSLSFEKDCGMDSICEADLTLNTRLPDRDVTVITGLTKSLPVDIQLENKGEDAYITTMIFTFPGFLIFNQVSKTEDISSPSVQCIYSISDNLLHPVLICNIGHPVFKANTKLNFTVSWQLDSGIMYPEEAAEISIAVNITNKNKGGPISKRHSFKVKHVLEVDLTQPFECSVNISKEMSQNFSSKFEVKGNNPFGATIYTVISIPVKVQGKAILKVKSVEGTQNATICKVLPPEEPQIVPTDIKDTWNCSAAECEHYQCTFTTDSENILVHVEIMMNNVRKLVKRSIGMEMKASLRFDESKFVRKNRGANYIGEAKAKITLIKEEQSFDFLKVIVGSSIGGFILLFLVIFLFYRCGFFKRNYKEKMEQDLQYATLDEKTN